MLIFKCIRRTSKVSPRLRAHLSWCRTACYGQSDAPKRTSIEIIPLMRSSNGSPVRFLLLLKRSLNRCIILMKIQFAMLIMAFLVSALPVRAQPAKIDLLDRLEKAISDGDVDAVMRMAGSRIDVSILDHGKNYSKSQAEFVLAQFFSSHPSTAFRFTASSTTGNGQFVEGLYYSTESRRPLNVYLRLKKKGERWELREFTVDRPRS